MRNNEYNIFNENKPIEENKGLSEIQSKKLGKEVTNPKIDVYKTSEYNNVSSAKKEKSNKSILKKLLQNITESTSSFVGSVAATAVVVVTSIVIFSNVIFNNPNIELVSLTEGYDFVSYNIVASDLEEDIDYYILISNSLESYEYNLIEGENINTINNLKHDSVYNLSVYGENSNNGTKVEYYTTRFFTIAQATNVPFNATYTLVDGPDAIIYWDNPDSYVVQLNTGFDNTFDSTLLYRVKLHDSKNMIDYIYEGTDRVATINVANDAESVIIVYEFIALVNNEEIICKTITMDNPIVFNKPTVELSDTLTLSGPNQYDLEFKIVTNNPSDEIYNSITFNILNNESIVDVIIIDSIEPNISVPLTITVPAGIGEITLEYEINLLGNNGYNERTILGSHTYPLITEYKLTRQVVDNSMYNTIKLYFDYHMVTDEITGEIFTITVENIDTNDIFYLSEIYNYVEINFDTTVSSIQLAYYLSDSTGEAVDTRTELTIDLSVNTNDYSSLYMFDYINPGDAIVTHNDDGTMNIYLDVKFETEDSSIYYGIVYDGAERIKEVLYTTSPAAYEGVILSDYYIQYNIYKKIGDVEYLIENIYPSGGIEFTYRLSLTDAIAIEENLITITFDSYYYNFDNTSFVITLDGIDYNIDSSQIVIDDTDSMCQITYVASSTPTECSVRFKGTTYYNEATYESLAAEIPIKGSIYATIYIES